MRRRGGFLGVLLGATLVLLLIIGAVAILAVSGKITVEGVTPKKTAGKVLEIGRFSASGIEVENVVGNVSVIKGHGKRVVVRSNLPVKAQLKNSILLVYCPEKRGVLQKRNVCNDYRNGTVIVEVPEEIGTLRVHNVVGGVFIGAASPDIEISNVVGRFTGSAWGNYHVSTVVGRVALRAKDNAAIHEVVGDVEVFVPPGYRALLSTEGVVGKVSNEANGENGTVELRVSNIAGDVTVRG